jgi:hypothetical protein
MTCRRSKRAVPRPGSGPARRRARAGRRNPVCGERGQASLLLLGVAAVLLAGLVMLFAFGQALGARGKHQRAADVAAISAAQVMRHNYARLFEPPLVPNGLPNPQPGAAPEAHVRGHPAERLAHVSS